MPKTDEAAPAVGRVERWPLLALALLLFVHWLLWSGHYTPLLLSLGALSCVGVTLLTWRMGIVDRETLPVHLSGRLLRYLGWLLWQVVLANLHVIRHVLQRRPGEVAETVRVELPQRTDLGCATYANSITLTPGTVTVDARQGHLVVHALTPEGAAELRRGEMGRRVLELEGGEP